jgi:hypothetical protein
VRLQLSPGSRRVQREQNIEADELSNVGTQSFDKKNEISVKLEDLQFIVLHDLMNEAKTFDGELLKKERGRDRESAMWSDGEETNVGG